MQDLTEIPHRKLKKVTIKRVLTSKAKGISFLSEAQFKCINYGYNLHRNQGQQSWKIKSDNTETNFINAKSSDS